MNRNILFWGEMP